jgi:TPP-dependent pyruvate/acetoin dehydrogenase alpha subunit
MAEMLGKATGCSKGKGGSMHFTDPSIGLLGANAIVGAGIPHAAGAALAVKLQGRDNVALTYFGEGAVNQGVFHETLNLAAVWQLPLIVLCENNLYSEMTPIRETSSVTEMTRRGEAFGIPAQRIDGNDVEAVYAAVEAAAAKARAGGGPTFIEAMTYRLWGHMMGDPEVYRSKDEVAQARQVEPIVRLGQRLSQLGHSVAELEQLDSEAAALVAGALQFAQASPEPSPESAFEDVFA